MAPSTPARTPSFSIMASFFLAMTALLLAVPSASAYGTQFVPLCVPEVACVRAHAGGGGAGAGACIHERGGTGIDVSTDNGNVLVYYPDANGDYRHSGSSGAC